jgi:hypothetical protein
MRNASIRDEARDRRDLLTTGCAKIISHGIPSFVSTLEEEPRGTY